MSIKTVLSNQSSNTPTQLKGMAQTSDTVRGLLSIAPKNFDLMEFTAGRAELSYIFSSAPRIDDSIFNSELKDVTYIGFSQQFRYTQRKQINPVKGIGTDRTLLLSTNMPGSGSISRLLYDSNSLIRSLLSYYLSSASTDKVAIKNLLNEFDQTTVTEVSGKSSNLIVEELLQDMLLARNVNMVDRPSITLYEEIANAPFGLIVVVCNKRGDVVKAEYIEECKLEIADLNISPNEVVITDNVSFQYDRVLPISATQLKNAFFS
jgi:hypothetical protein